LERFLVFALLGVLLTTWAIYNRRSNERTRRRMLAEREAAQAPKTPQAYEDRSQSASA